ncbi:MAG: two-component sensor histidine kinase, partial [Bacteroidetes bacterium]|nr:two-component sensor histidine kinase [Bacteroidota bacterium]
MLICRKLGGYFLERDNALAVRYHTRTLTLARKLRQSLWEAEASNELSYEAYEAGDYPQSLSLANAGIRIAENEDSEKGLWRPTEFSKDGDPHKARIYLLGLLYEKLGYLYLKTGNNLRCSSSYFKAIKIAASVNDEVGLSFYNEDLGDYYLAANKLDSALEFSNRGLKYARASGYKLYEGGLLANIGEVYFRRGSYVPAKKYYFESVKANQEQSNAFFLPRTFLLLADLYRTTGKRDSDIYYARLALKNFKTQHDRPNVEKVYSALYTAYKHSGQRDSAFLYLQRSKALADSLDAIEKVKLRQYLSIGFNDQLRVQELEKEKIQVQTRNRTYIMLAGIGIFVIIASILYGNNKQKQKANKVLENTLLNLKSAQTQLIQSEKMASLGELTAGIAHEIQNPLNFVNNFSDVNREILEELKAESERPKAERDEKLETELINDVIENEQKINHHGKRAEAIVKGMLQHSRTSSGQKEPTNLNTLADEYLRLAYHGLRAKDKNFNAELITRFDEKLPKVNVIPQDIGRVLLNVINNAFYAVQQKAKIAGPDYKPEVVITTAQQNGAVIISVKDNGNGIPDAIKDKIMQP